MEFPSFHIALDGPADSIFPSFPSSELGNGDPSQITLAMIRRKCRVSPKLFFTADGKNRLADSTSLKYYMMLSKEGQSILTPSASEKSVPAPVPEQPQPGGESAEKPGIQSEQQPATETEVGASIHTLSIRVTDGKSPVSLVPLPTTQAGMREFMDRHAGQGLTLGQLPTFTDRDRELASLTKDWSATPSGRTDLPEPYDMTEQHWDQVLTNNRALHGYYYDKATETLIKAPKRVFDIRLSGAQVKQSSTGTDSPSRSDAQAILPQIPPFYVDDDAQVSVIQIKRNFQKKLVKEGFSSVAVEASAAAGPMQSAVSVSAAWENEHATASQNQTSVGVDSLAVLYKFPRIVIELDADCLELTKQCKYDAQRVVDDAGVKKFYRKYGNIFVTRFTLGGFLHSTRNVTSSEIQHLDQVKDKTRRAAGISIQTPKGSGGLNYSKVDSQSQESGSASLYEEVHLTWDARGGDTLLCSNPPAWASTVKDYRLWRLMEQHRTVSLKELIKEIDTSVHHHLAYPSFQAGQSEDDDLIKNPEFNSKVREILLEALMDPDQNKMARKIEDYYGSSGPDRTAYNEFLKLIQEPNMEIKPKTKYGAMSFDQKVAFGLWMVYKKALDIN